MGKSIKKENSKISEVYFLVLIQKPKVPQSAYYLYKNEVFDTIRRRNPDAKLSDVTRIIADKFKCLCFDDKKYYEDLANELKVDYREKLREYNEFIASSSAARREFKEKDSRLKDNYRR